MKSRLGRWLLIGFYETYLDQFARVAEAADNYNLKGGRLQVSLRFRLHRSIHRLEKSLSLHPRRAGAGRDNALELSKLMTQWPTVCSPEHPTYVWGQHVIAKYLEMLSADIATAANGDKERLTKLHAELAGVLNALLPASKVDAYRTPVDCSDIPKTLDLAQFENLLKARKSVRRWLDEPVPREAIERALEHALRSPSACNRQPFAVSVLQDRPTIQKAAALLTGGGGFADRAPLLLVLTSDFGAYGGHEQRNLAYIDGSLAAMTFLLSLTAQGYATVPMNWSVEVGRDLKLRSLLGLTSTQVILFLVGVGRPHPEALIPASIRPPISEALSWI